MNWPESVLETALITLVAIPVVLLTRRLVLRLPYLEDFFERKFCLVDQRKLRRAS